VGKSLYIEDRGFESRQGVRFLGLQTLQCCSLQLNLHCYCVYWSEISDKKKYFFINFVHSRCRYICKEGKVCAGHFRLSKQLAERVSSRSSEAWLAFSFEQWNNQAKSQMGIARYNCKRGSLL
jgi:hypothetical protein